MVVVVVEDSELALTKSVARTGSGTLACGDWRLSNLLIALDFDMLSLAPSDFERTVHGGRRIS